MIACQTPRENRRREKLRDLLVGAGQSCGRGAPELFIQPSGIEEALNALAKFKAYAAGTLLVLDLVGTFVFALSGAVAGVKERLDLFAVLVLSFAAASAGGIMSKMSIAYDPRHT